MHMSAKLDYRNRPAEPGGAIADLSIHDDLRPIEAEWRAFERSAVGHVFQTYDWITAWQDHVGPARQVVPCIAVARCKNGRPVCLLPFGIRNLRGVRILEWLGAEHADYHGGLFDAGLIERLGADGDAFSDLFAQLVDAIGSIDLVHFIRQPVTLGEYPNPFVTLPSFRNADGAHSTRLGEDWESYYHARRGKGWRRTDRNKLKKLGELGEVSFVTARSPAQRDDILAALFSQKAKGLARAGVSDMFAPPGVRSFYASLAERAWPDGPAHLCALYCGEQIVAANLGVVRGDTYYYVLHAYDVDNLASLSPGRQLMYEIMQWSIANGIDRFDFTIGDEAYKDTWCDETLELYDSVVPMTLRGHTAALTYRLLQNTKRIVKSQRHLWTMARFMRTQLRRSRIG